jgi:Domain of unknown function (DUF4440)
MGIRVPANCPRYNSAMKPALLLALLAMILTPAPRQQSSAQQAAAQQATTQQTLAQPTNAQQTATEQTTPAPELGTEPDFIFIQELNLWKALQSHDLAAFHAYLLPDFLNVEKTIQTRDQIMANLGTCTLVSSKIRNHQLRMLSPDAAILTYTRSSETTCGESHLTGDYNATTTWVRREGKWFVQIHTETAARP